MRFWLIGSFGVLAALAVATACHDNPSIDGSRVPGTANPTCAEVCARLDSLCGYAPVDCTTSCEEFDEPHRVCIGQARSCRDALEGCADESEEAGDDGGAEGEDELDAGDSAS